MRRNLTMAGLVLALAAGAAAGGAVAQSGTTLPKPAPRNWNTVVTRLPSGTHLLGNPAAKVRLTQFVSYTCPHCAHFEQESDAQLRLTLVSTGTGAVEVRNFVRDPVDLAAALLTNCGAPSRFFGNHTMFMRQQAKWIAPLANPGPTQQQRWGGGAFAQRMRFIAKDFGFYPMMQSRGYTIPQIDACLADEAKARRLAAGTEEAARTLAIEGTPSFAINGALVPEVHSWSLLRPRLAEAAKAN